MSRVDVLCKFQSLDKMIDSYGSAIEEIILHFNELSNLCDVMETEEHWLGEAHDAYMKLYYEWKKSFQHRLAALITFQAALVCIRDSLRTIMEHRINLINDITLSNASSPVSADSDYPQVLRVAYENAFSAEYEIGSSNPRFIERIHDYLQDAKKQLNGVDSSKYPEIQTVRKSIDDMCTDLDDEYTRYTGFSASYYSFCAGVQAMESTLASTVNSMFTDQLANMSTRQVNILIGNYAKSGFSYDLSQLNIPQTDAIFLIELNILLNTKDVTADEIRALCDEYEKLGANKALVDSIVEEGLEELFSNSAEDVLVDAIAVYLGKTTALSARDLADKSILIASQISRLSAKADVIIGKMGKKVNYYPESGYYKTRLRTLQEAIDSLSDEKKFLDKELNATINLGKWGKVLSWSFIGADVAVEGFRSRVIDGLDWDDVCQDMADEALAGIGGLATGTVITYAMETIGAGAEGAAAGPAGVALGSLVGIWLAVEEPLHGKFEEISDWWDMLCW